MRGFIRLALTATASVSVAVLMATSAHAGDNDTDRHGGRYGNGHGNGHGDGHGNGQAPLRVLFVGNSYTFGRADPQMSFNHENVTDLTAPRPDDPEPNFTDTTGANPWEPHPWGGVPGIFKSLTDQAGLDLDVSLSTRNAATLRGHFLNTANASWDLRGNIASQKWDIVLIQEQSDATLPPGRGRNANFPQFSAYADKIEQFIHIGAGESYRERAMYAAIYGSLDACVAAGGTSSSCDNNTLRTIPTNPNASAATRVYLTQTWARPDMVFPHLSTVSDANYPTVPDGSPIVDTSDPAFPNGFPDTLYYTQAEGLAAMTADLHAAMVAKAAANPQFAGVVWSGDAFQRAINDGVAQGSGFYGANGQFVPEVIDPSGRAPVNLWWKDLLHASRHGYYLSALMVFGTLTNIDPTSFDGRDDAAEGLGIPRKVAERLQEVARDQLVAANIALRRMPCLGERGDGGHGHGRGGRGHGGDRCRR